MPELHKLSYIHIKSLDENINSQKCHFHCDILTMFAQTHTFISKDKDVNFNLGMLKSREFFSQYEKFFPGTQQEFSTT